MSFVYMHRTSVVSALLCLGLSAGCAAGGSVTSDDAGNDVASRPDVRDSDTDESDAPADAPSDVADAADIETDSDTALMDTALMDTALMDTAPTDTAPTDTAPTDTNPTDTAGDTEVDANPGFECSPKTELVYLIDKDEQLHSFEPRTGAITLVGDVDCGTFAGTPGSMGLSRLGTAYVNYSDSEVYAVSIEDGSCTASGWTAQSGEFDRFGMGYAADAMLEETLYVASAERLARIDTTTWQLTPIGNLPSQCELAGTARGELWGFFPLENPPQLLQLDPSDASVLASHDLPPLPSDLDTFAFTVWGGEFYIFYRVFGLGNSTNIYTYNLITGETELVMADAGINVVGAGVSICAPTGG